jgi:hypothetical protein
MIALRVFRLISDLKIAVEVGLVVGTIPQIMPIGSAMVIVPKVSSSENTAGLFIFIGVVDIFGSKVVFDHFVFNDAHAGFGNGHFGERDSSICSGQAAARKILSTCS